MSKHKWDVIWRGILTRGLPATSTLMHDDVYKKTREQIRTPIEIIIAEVVLPSWNR